MQFFPHSNTHSPTKRPQDSFIHRILNDPYLDWFYMVIITTVLVGVYVGIGFMTYFSVQNRLATPTTVETTVPSAVFDPGTLSRTIKYFDNRATERARVTKGYSGIGDPSL